MAAVQQASDSSEWSPFQGEWSDAWRVLKVTWSEVSFESVTAEGGRMRVLSADVSPEGKLTVVVASEVDEMPVGSARAEERRLKGAAARPDVWELRVAYAAKESGNPPQACALEGTLTDSLGSTTAQRFLPAAATQAAHSTAAAPESPPPPKVAFTDLDGDQVEFVAEASPWGEISLYVNGRLEVAKVSKLIFDASELVLRDAKGSMPFVTRGQANNVVRELKDLIRLHARRTKLEELKSAPPPPSEVPASSMGNARMLLASSGRHNFKALPVFDLPFDLGARSTERVDSGDRAGVPPKGRLGGGVSAGDLALLGDAKKVCAMLKREEEMRLEPRTQQLLDARGESHGELIYLALQQLVAREAGFADWAGLGVRALRNAPELFPEGSPGSEAVHKALPFWVRHNKASEGPLAAGGAAPVDTVHLAALPKGLGLGDLAATAGASQAGASQGAGQGAAARALGLPWLSLRDHLSTRPGPRTQPVCLLAGSAT